MGTKTVYRLVQQHRPPSPAVPVNTLLAVDEDRDRALATFSDVLAELGDNYGPLSRYRLVLQSERVKA